MTETPTPRKGKKFWTIRMDRSGRYEVIPAVFRQTDGKTGGKTGEKPVSVHFPSRARHPKMN